MRVLFIGNSFTLNYNLPGITGALATAHGTPFAGTALAHGGWTLAMHLDTGIPQRMIAEGGWDAVVLQDYSYRPVSDPDGTVRDFSTFGPLIRTAGAEPIAYQTFAYTDELARCQGLSGWEAMHTALTATYERAAQEIGARLAPVGSVWAAVRREHPEWEYHIEDGKHPSPLGGYLNAATMATVFANPLDAAKLPARLHATNPLPPDETPDERAIEADTAQRELIARAARTAVASSTGNIRR